MAQGKGRSQNRLNRTSVGLKPQGFQRARQPADRLNRTSVGLKPSFLVSHERGRASLNRTSVGLKPRRGSAEMG